MAMRYDYRCEGCGHVEEQVRSPNDPGLHGGGECPKCGVEMVKVFQVREINVPSHFMHHTHTTGLKDIMGCHPDIRRRTWDRNSGI